MKGQLIPKSCLLFNFVSFMKISFAQQIWLLNFVEMVNPAIKIEVGAGI